jgi:hypothetical protein
MENEELVFLLEIDEKNEESGMDMLSFVSKPATQVKWEYFQEQESFNDYPKAASENACKVLEWIDEYGRDEVEGMELTGLNRANQLCKRERISKDTIARIASFNRHRKNSEIDPDLKGMPWKDKGYVAWLGWGGDEMVDWAIRKMEQFRREQKMGHQFTDINDEKRIVMAPVMLADTKIVRHSNEIGKYYVKFTPETIEKMMRKYFVDGKINNVNVNHEQGEKKDDIYMIESFIVGDRTKSMVFSDIPDGSWVASYYVGNDEIWEKIKSGEYNGFSLEGSFFQKIEDDYIQRTYERLKTIIDGDGTDEEKESQIKELLNIK